MVLLLKIYAVFSLLFILLANADADHQRKIPVIKKLSDDLLSNYSKYILPSEREPFHIKIEADILALGDIDEVEEKLSSVFWMYYTWTDESIHWDKNQTNVEWITLGYKDVWTPVLRVSNPHVDESKSQSVDRSYDVITYKSKGEASYDEMVTTRTTCDLDMTYYPFDIQNCSVVLMVVGGKTSFLFDLDFSLRKTFSKEDAEHGSWRLLDTGYEVDDGSFSIILIFERKPLFLLINIILPLIVLALLTPVVFLLPEDSERVGYAVTMLLAISVYMIIVSENLPSNSQPMPLISIMIFIWYVFDAVIVFVVIVNTKIHSMTSTAQLPFCVRKFVLLTEKMTSCITCNICRNKATDESPGEKETCLELTAEDDKGTDGNSSNSEEHLTPGKATWQDVSKSIDKWSFVVSYFLKILLPIIFFIIVKTQ